MSYLSIFRLEFEKFIVICEITTLEFIKNPFSTNAVNFGIASAFYKGSGSAFYEGLGPGLGPLYKF